MTKEQIAELRKLLREAPTEIREFKEAAADVILTARAREVLPRLLDEREALLEALKEARRLLAECDTSLGVPDLTEFDAAIAKAEAP